MTTTYALLLDRCGLSHREAAEFHGVRLDTVKSWSAGRNGVPPGAIDELRALYAKIETAAAEAVALIRAQAAEDVELGLARDDGEARSLGWPCVGAQAASFGLAAARATIPVRVARGGAAAAEIERLRAFVRWAVTDGPFNGSSLDGGDVQEKAVHFGILRKVEYDPEQHGQNDCGAEPGDPWFVFTFPVHDEQKGNQG